MTRATRCAVMAIGIWATLVVGCGSDDNGDTDAGLANPASAFCEDQGGSVEIERDAAGNERGICVLADGTRVDEWEYYRDNAPTSVADGEPWLQVAPARVGAGDDVAVSGWVPFEGDLACSSGDAVVLTSTSDLFPPDGVGPTAPRDGLGDFAVSVAVPADTPAGSYTIGLRCGGGNIGVSAQLEVVAG